MIMALPSEVQLLKMSKIKRFKKNERKEKIKNVVGNKNKHGKIVIGKKSKN